MTAAVTDDFNEPLLTRSVPHTPPRHAFQIRLRSTTHDSSSARNAHVVVPVTHQYWWDVADTKSFYKNALMALLIGPVMAVLWAGLYYTISSGQSYVYGALNHNNTTITKSTLLVVTAPNINLPWYWPLITAAGGLLAGFIVYTLPAAYEAVQRSTPWDIHSPSPYLAVLGLLIPAGIIVLILGAPLGPEFVACGLARGVVRLMELASGGAIVSEWHGMALSAMVTCIVGCGDSMAILVGPIVMYELQANVYSSSTTSSITVTSGNASTTSNTQMSQFVIYSLASLAASLIQQTYFASSILIPYLIEGNSSSNYTTDKLYWQAILISVVLAVMCACIGTLTVWLGRLLSQTRNVCSTIICTNSSNTLAAVMGTSLLFPTLAGLVYGCLSRWIIVSTVSASVWTRCMTVVCRLIGLAACTSWGLVGGPIVSLGVTGVWIGHSIQGLSEYVVKDATMRSLLQSDLAVTVSVVSLVSSLCPIPVSIMLTVLCLSNSNSNVGTFLTASITAYMVSNLLLRPKNSGISSDHNNTGGSTPGSSVSAQPDEHQDTPATFVTDDELLQSIRNAIFGQSESV